MKFLMYGKSDSVDEALYGMIFPCEGYLKNVLVLIAGQGEEAQITFSPNIKSDEALPTVDTDISKQVQPKNGFKLDVMNIGGSNPNSSTDYMNLYKKFFKYAGHVKERELWYLLMKKVSAGLAVLVQGDFIPKKGAYYVQNYQTTVSSTANYSKAYRVPVKLRNVSIELSIMFKDTADVGGYINIRAIRNRDFEASDLLSDVEGSGFHKVSLADKKVFDSTLIARIPLAKQANGANVMGALTKTIPVGNMSRLEGIYFDYDDIIANALDVFEASFSIRGIVAEQQTPHLRDLRSPMYMEVP